MAEHMIHNIAEHSEDARSTRRTQYAVRLIYGDGRTGIHIRENRLSAENTVAIHKELMVTEPEWEVVDVGLIQRTITLTLAEWEESN